jgi:hypothetical protein
VLHAQTGSEAMRRSRFSVEQLTYALKQVETGMPVAEVCRKLGINADVLRLEEEVPGHGRRRGSAGESSARFIPNPIAM